MVAQDRGGTLCARPKIRKPRIYQMQKWQDLLQRRKAIRLKNFDYSNSDYVYFITICARHLSSPFSDSRLAHEVLKVLLSLREQGRIFLYCYCLMPDHLHTAMSPCISSRRGRSEDLSQLIGDFKSYTTRLSWKHGVKGKLWQRSFYDHIGRRGEDLVAICEYILNNPARKGLVEDPNNWPYSGLLDPLPL